MARVLRPRVDLILTPLTNERILSGTAQISGGGIYQTSAKLLASQLKFGSLPVSFQVQNSETISAVLGDSQLKSGLLAGLIGLILVVIYSLLQYRALGLVTIFSLGIAGSLTYVDFDGPPPDLPYIPRNDVLDTETDPVAAENKMAIAITRVQDPALVPQDQKWTVEIYKALAQEYIEITQNRNAVTMLELTLLKFPMNRDAPVTPLPAAFTSLMTKSSNASFRSIAEGAIGQLRGNAFPVRCTSGAKSCCAARYVSCAISSPRYAGVASVNTTSTN